MATPAPKHNWHRSHHAFNDHYCWVACWVARHRTSEEPAGVESLGQEVNEEQALLRSSHANERSLQILPPLLPPIPHSLGTMPCRSDARVRSFGSRLHERTKDPRKREILDSALNVRTRSMLEVRHLPILPAGRKRKQAAQDTLITHSSTTTSAPNAPYIVEVHEIQSDNKAEAKLGVKPAGGSMTCSLCLSSAKRMVYRVGLESILGLFQTLSDKPP